MVLFVWAKFRHRWDSGGFLTMTRFASYVFVLIASTGCGIFVQQARGGHAGDSRTHVRELAAALLPAMNGDRLAVKVQEVTYPPGGSSSVHTHPCPVIGYVVNGAVRMRVQGEAEKVYSAGESFYEAPNSIHLISANASESKPATFVAHFICDHDTELTIPAALAASGAHR
jgi:quercetin dioxygenase-like cupin family protein